MRLIKTIILRFSQVNYKNVKRFCSTNNIRNIGILAHIDAGKTTTTERMLYYSGKTSTLGEVHNGNTITDYLTQERERGITICSSAVSFPWNNHKINLLDTPGHIDFTMEVEQSLFAVDGVVVILDGTAGVEAQTITVWHQATKHNLPKIIFINKLDRPDVDLNSCLKSIERKLGAVPVCLQFSTKDCDGNINIIDNISMKRFIWDGKTFGREYKSIDLGDELELFECQERRNNIIEQLASKDDLLAALVINNNGYENIIDEEIRSSLRRLTCQQMVVPVLLGSAYKNLGIQLLMNSVIDFFPQPMERNEIYNCFNNDFVGKVFKIVHDKHRGALSLVRIFRGSLKKGMRVVSGHGSIEIINKMYEPLADDYREISISGAGDVCLCAGLKNTVTGDLVTSSVASLQKAQKRLKNSLEQQTPELSSQNNSEPECISHFKDDTGTSIEFDLVNEIFRNAPHVPEAVFFCSIEPPNTSSQTAMDQALKQLQREDPSLRVSYNKTTGQTVLGGMGELHMEVIKSRILTEYKVDVELGPLQIAYKETIDDSDVGSIKLEKDIVGNKQSVFLTIELVNYEKEVFSLDKHPDNVADLNKLRPRVIQLISKGAIGALERGPRIGGQVVDTQIKLHKAIIGRGTADSFIMAAATQCVQKILTAIGTRLMEPIMAVEINTPENMVSTIINDLARRRSVVNGVLDRSKTNKLILVSAPLAELSGYSTILRRISSGTASVTMQPSCFAIMSSVDEKDAMQRAQGF